MPNWIRDDSGDLVNLNLIEAVVLNPIGEDQEGPQGHTHELLAINQENTSYRLTSGDEGHCRNLLAVIAQSVSPIDPESIRGSRS